MKANPILEEIWQIKDELSREFAADPDAYFAKLDEITDAEEKAGRKVIRSAEELQQLVVQRERQHAEESAMALNDKLPRKKK
jgi:TnpA family transposase